MHTNEIVHDTFIPRWFGRLGNNIQQISNAIYFCRKNGISFSSPESVYLNAINYNFGSNQFKIKEDSHNWFYFYNGPDADFDVDIDDLNRQRKSICEEYILPALKINHEELNTPVEDLIVHIRSGDLYTRWPATHTQNPLAYYIQLYIMYSGKVIFVAEDNHNPIVGYLKYICPNILTLNEMESYTLLLRAKNLATSGAGSFAISAAFCSPNLENLYCTDLYLKNSLNPTMLKEQLNVLMADVSGNKYFKVGEWNTAQHDINKILQYEDHISFRRL
jgi:hypothetical protein